MIFTAKAPIKIMKFGGTSVATESARGLMIGKVKHAVAEGYRVVLVVSAMGRLGQPYATDTLLSLLPRGIPDNAPERDLLMSCGETITASLVASLMRLEGISCLPLMGFQAGIITDDNHGDANVVAVETHQILKLLESYQTLVVTGFQGISGTGLVTTLGRGGSDYTASVLGVHLDAEIIEIYTDVDGVMSADPRVVKDAKVLKQVTHSEVYQMAVDGAKVVDHKAVALAMKANKPLVIKNTFSEEEGTVIQGIEYDHTGEFIERGSVFTAITAKKQLVLYTCHLGPDQRQEAEQMLIALESAGLTVDMLNFFSSKKLFVGQEKQGEAVEAILKALNISYSVQRNLSKVTGVGAQVRYMPDIVKSVMRVLMLEEIEVYQTAKTDSTVSCLIDAELADRIVNNLHSRFL